MASRNSKIRKDGVASYQVKWRRADGSWASETFAAGTTSENDRRSAAFKAAVEAAGNDWPEGWIKGQGYAKAPESPKFLSFALDVVGQNAELAPRQKSDYKRKIEALSEMKVIGADGKAYRPFAGTLLSVDEADVRRWMAQWDRSAKTKSNYHGLLFTIFAEAQYQGLIPRNPCARTGMSRRKLREGSRPVIVLTEEQAKVFLDLEPDQRLRDMYTIELGTGLRFSELTSLWCEDVDLANGRVTVRKAWKRTGDDGEDDVPAWLKSRLKPKHKTLTYVYLGVPKTQAALRTITIPPVVVESMERLMDGKEPDDFLVTSAQGRALHYGNWNTRWWNPLVARGVDKGLPDINFHDLRHTHASWLINVGIPLPTIQHRLGHESIQTTIDVYGHLLTHQDEAMDTHLESALRF